VRWLAAAAVAGLALSAGPARAQEPPTFLDAVFGRVPGTLKLKELSGEWRRMTLVGPADASGATQSVGGLMSGLMGAMFGGGTAPKAPNPLPYYSQGRVVRVGEEVFLITYRAHFRPLDMTAMMAAKGPGDLPPPEKLTAESALALTLVNVRSISSISDIRPFDMERELAESARAAEDEVRLRGSLGQGPGGPAGFGGAAGVFSPEPVTAPDSPVTAPAEKPRPVTKQPAPVKKPAPRKK
jgi:hypothetical protein